MSDRTTFSREQAARLTGLAEDRLARWARQNHYRPAFERSGRYSFVDLVALRVLGRLCDGHGARIGDLDGFGAWLREHARVDNPWASLRFKADGREIIVHVPGGGQWISKAPLGQLVMVDELELDFAEIVASLRTAAAAILRRTEDQVGRIEKVRGVLGSAPVFAGTRIPVEAVRQLRQDGCSEDEILRAYPRLTAADVKAALEHDESAA